MQQANDSVLVTPGSGATIATHTANSKEHQAIVPVDANGYLLGEAPQYFLYIPGQAMTASLVFFDLFNASGSGKTIRLTELCPILASLAAVTGVYQQELFLTRTTAVGTGGTTTAGDAYSPGTAVTSLTVSSLARRDISSATADSYLPSQVTARVAPSGGATAGQVLSYWASITEETNAAASFQQRFRMPKGGIIIPEASGIRVIGGATGSPVGTIGFHGTFETY